MSELVFDRRARAHFARLMYPFQFAPEALDETRRRIETGTARPSKEHEVEEEWPGPPPELPVWVAGTECRAYAKEGVPTHEKMFWELPQYADQKKAGLQAYYRLNHRLLEAWTDNNLMLEVVLNGDRYEKHVERNGQGAELETVRARFDNNAGVELFLYDFGIGVVSLSLWQEAGREGLSVDEVAAFNYHLSHLRYRVPRLRRRAAAHSLGTALFDDRMYSDPVFQTWRGNHLGLEPGDEEALRADAMQAEDAKWLAKDSADLQRRALLVLSESRDLDRRLGRRGLYFTLLEFLEWLTPVQKLGVSPTEDLGQFLVYSVVRYGTEVTFEGATREQASQLASALAKIEEPRHAAAVPDDPGTPCATLNSKHFCACSPLGTAHLVADQWVEGSESSYDAQRMNSAQYQYFAAFLVPFLQRSRLLEFQRQVQQLLVGSSNSEKVQNLSQECARFLVSANLTMISRREPVNLAYELSRSAQRVVASAVILEKAFANLEMALNLRDQTASLRSMEETQRTVEWIELFIVGVYGAEIAHIVMEAFEVPHAPAGFIALGTMLAAVCITWVTTRVLKKRRAVVKGWTLVLLVTGALTVLAGLTKFYYAKQAPTKVECSNCQPATKK